MLLVSLIAALYLELEHQSPDGSPCRPAMAALAAVTRGPAPELRIASLSNFLIIGFGHIVEYSIKDPYLLGIKYDEI
jgi:hypothetical protein